jgi:alpha-1,2-mannosyltransferase
MLVTSVLAYRLRHLTLAVITATGIALMVWTPIVLMPEHHETAASLWRQLAGGSYVWWAIAVIAVAGTVSVESADRSVSRQLIPASAPAA